MNKFIFIAFASCFLSFSIQGTISVLPDFIIANGQMPDIVKDKNNNLHLVFGKGDSILYSYSSDNGNTFSSPSLISVIPGLYSFATRGPQIAATIEGVVVTASTSKGEIFSFYKDDKNKWMHGGKVNDADTTAKEGLMALSGDGNNAYAVWLDVRDNNRNKIYGASSKDGGRSWSANKMIYKSPDTTVCECCKPSVIIKDHHVYVMFRNWLHGNRDLYLIQSKDDGNTFGKAQKLGTTSWVLNGCPMDGGALALNKGTLQTVWRRKSGIFTNTPGRPEKEIGEGKNCTIAVAGDKSIYAWTENGEVIVVKPQGQKQAIGKGSEPQITALDDNHIICIWENDKKIHGAVIKL
jgi:hypothetical protein